MVLAQPGGGGGGGGGEGGGGPGGGGGGGGRSSDDRPRNLDNLGQIRSIDGSEEDGNSNSNRGGAAGERLIRRAPADYPDGLGNALYLVPNARTVSNLVSANSETPVLAATASDMLWIWGQFLDHDVDLSGEGGETETITSEDPDDPIMSITMHRSDFEEDEEGVRQQTNIVTSYIDASMVYGSDSARAAELREYTGGRLNVQQANNLLPLNLNDFENAALDRNIPTEMFLAGDVRANEQLGLATMHTLFVREHNRLVTILDRAYPDADDEDLYQMGRKLVGAMIQRITYNEFLPLLLGNNARVVRLFNEYQPSDFRESVNPAISNEFSTVAFRVGHTMLSSEFKIGLNEEMQLADAFFNPEIIQDTPQIIDHLIHGFCTSEAQKVDTLVIDDVRNKLFGKFFSFLLYKQYESP